MTEGLSADINIDQSIDLKPYNSLAVSAVAEYFCSVNDIDQLRSALLFAKDNNLFVTPIGGGSNVVLASDIAGLVVHINIKGITVLSADRDNIDIRFAAGENWHSVVTYCLENGWYGLENLALIPGDMGAAPIQNIGAYGVELCDFVQSVEVIERDTGNFKSLSLDDCKFGYRTSVFKQAAKDSYIIIAVTLTLSKLPKVNTDYPSLRASIDSDHPSPQEIYDTVSHIRRQKLPDPNEIPNVGSFFKNPIVTKKVADRLAQDYPELPIYAYSQSQCKLAAAWLIEHCGFKGCRKGDVGVHSKQALVLVNYQGDGGAVLALAKEIKSNVLQTFAVELHIEPRIYGLNQDDSHEFI
jgi:UDP-N-acetylmuramate dehydrogenase